MPRKRAAAAEVTPEAPAPDVFDEAIAARQAEAAAAAQASAEPAPEQSFAEKVGKKQYQPAPDPFGIASDYVAGVHLSESKRYGKMLLAFDEKPTPEVTGKLKEAGFRWEPLEKVWTIAATMAGRITADRVFKDVSKLIREQRGIEHSAGMAIG